MKYRVLHHSRGLTMEAPPGFVWIAGGRLLLLGGVPQMADRDLAWYNLIRPAVKNEIEAYALSRGAGEDG